MKNLIVGIFSILILISIFPVFNIKAEGLGNTSLTAERTSIMLYGTNHEYAKLIYNRVGETFDYLLNAKNLLYNTSYTLIYYPEDENNILCLGDGVSNMIGQLGMKVERDIPTIPYSTDPNAYPETTTYEDGSIGAKIWLVRTNQIDCINHTMDVDSLTDVLFEDSLISYYEV